MDRKSISAAARKRASRQRTSKTLGPSRQSTILQNSDPLQKLKTLDYLFVRHSRNRESFFQLADLKYDLVDIDGVHRYYAMEIKGSAEAVGAERGDGDGEDEAEAEAAIELPDTHIIITALDGKELLRMSTFKPTKSVGSRYTLHQNSKFIGEVVQTNDSCSDVQFEIVGEDERGFGIITPCEESKSCCGCLNCCATKLNLSENAAFNIHLPSRRRILGRIGKISTQPEIPSQFKAWYGVEFSKEVEMGTTDRSILLLCLFILKIPNKTWK